MGIDGTLLSLQSGDALQKALSSKSIELVCETENCVDLIWKDQPAIPCTPVIYLTPSDAGLSVKEKVDLVSNYSNSSRWSTMSSLVYHDSPRISLSIGSFGSEKARMQYHRVNTTSRCLLVTEHSR